MASLFRALIPDRVVESVQLAAGENPAGPDVVPHNSWDGRWDPCVPEVAEAFTVEPIAWSLTCPDASAAALLNEVRLQMLKSGLVEEQTMDYAACALRIASNEDQALAQLCEVAAAAEAPPRRTPTPRSAQASVSK